MNTNHKAGAQLLALTLWVAGSGPALAQDQTSHGKVETVVVTGKRYGADGAVTATKTDTPILLTPANVQVVTQQVLQDQQVVTINQALQNVSGISEGGGGANNNGQQFSTVRLRGFASDAFLVDGTRLYSFGGDSDLYTEQFAGIDRVEVLKGPAAILYGSLEPGGIVNIVSKQPESTPDYQAQQQFGSFGLYRTSVDATGPIDADAALSYRIDGSFSNDGSPVRYIYNDTRFLAPTLRWDIDPATEVTLEFKYRYADFGQNYGTVPLLNGSPVSGPDVNYGSRSPERESTYFGALTWSHDFDDDFTVRQRFVFNSINAEGAGVLPAEIQTGLATPSGVGVGRWINNVVNHDWNANVTTDFVKKLTILDTDHTILFGGDFAAFSDHGHIDQAGEVDSNVSFVDFFDPSFVLNPFACCTTPLIVDSSWVNTAGLYLQDEVALPWRLHLLAGARWQYLRQGGSFDFPAFGLVNKSEALTADKITPRVGLLWQATDWLNPYVSYVENFGPSGAGYTLANGSQPPPSQGSEWEFGAKASLLGGNITATADYYDLTKTNIPTPDIANPGFVTVIGEAESKGVELDVVGALTDHWNIILNYAHNHVVTTKASALDTNPVGTHFGGVPDDQLHLWTTYAFDAPPLAGLKIGGGFTYAGSAAATLISAGTPQSVPGYVTADLMLSYEFKTADADWMLQLNATNIFNKTYVTDSQAYAFSGVGPYSLVTNIYGDPREFVGSIKIAL